MIVAFAVMCFVKSQRRERKQVGMQSKQVEEEVKSFRKMRLVVESIHEKEEYVGNQTKKLPFVLSVLFARSKIFSYIRLYHTDFISDRTPIVLRCTGFSWLVTL